jgi:hypothetical protein
MQGESNLPQEEIAAKGSGTKWSAAHQLTKLSSSWEHDISEVVKTFPDVVWTTKVHRRFHNSPPLVRILCQINALQAVPYYFFTARFNSILSSTPGYRKSSVVFRFPYQNICASPFSPRRVTCPNHLITLKWPPELCLVHEIKTITFSSNNCLQPRFISRLLDKKNHPQHHIPDHHQPTSFLCRETHQVLHPYQI